VQCGAPVLWPNCNKCEWAEPLWYSVIGRLHKKTPVLNLAAGSCYPWEKQPEKIAIQRTRIFENNQFILRGYDQGCLGAKLSLPSA
jgi:hypothetical protein